MDPNTPLKPGVQTPQFWLTLISSVVLLLQPMLGDHTLSQGQEDALAAAIVAIYTVAETWRHK